MSSLHECWMIVLYIITMVVLWEYKAKIVVEKVLPSMLCTGKSLDDGARYRESDEPRWTKKGADPRWMGRQ
jgi:hypothetical protein